MPDKYDEYLKKIGGITLNNILQQQQSNKQVYQLSLSKETSSVNAQQESQSKVQKKTSTKQKNPNLEQENDQTIEDESSGSCSQFQNNNKNNDSNTCGTAIKNKFDTKNLVKNFLNQFLSFVCSEEEEKQIMELLDLKINSELVEYKNMLKLFFKNKKFNRALLKEFIFQVDYRKLFDYFLTHRANDWINQGRMKDKASHFRALQNFQYICQNHDEIKSWRFRYNFV